MAICAVPTHARMPSYARTHVARTHTGTDTGTHGHRYSTVSCSLATDTRAHICTHPFTHARSHGCRAFINAICLWPRIGARSHTCRHTGTRMRTRSQCTDVQAHTHRGTHAHKYTGSTWSFVLWPHAHARTHARAHARTQARRCRLCRGEALHRTMKL